MNYKKLFLTYLGFVSAIIFIGCGMIYAQAPAGKVKIRFIHTANGKPLELGEVRYQNFFGEEYQVSKFKYYVSHIGFTGKSSWQDDNSYYLVNAANEENSIEISLPPGNYPAMHFLLGVDSIRNCSGAQDGALDPMNDMFWTWNTGYVMLKLEGNSPASTADLNRLEYHIGGYKGNNNVATPVSVDLLTKGGLTVKPGKTTEIIIETNLDAFWHADRDVKIAEHAVCMTTGLLAKKIAANFPSLFSLKNIGIAIEN